MISLSLSILILISVSLFCFGVAVKDASDSCGTVQRDKLIQKLQAKKEAEATMSPEEKRRAQKEEKKQDKKIKLTRDDSKFQTIRF